MISTRFRMDSSKDEFQRFSSLRDQELKTHFQHLKIETLEEQDL